MWSINNFKEIRMTRGDTPTFTIKLFIEDVAKKKHEYVPTESDHIIFAIGRSDEDEPLIVKEIKDMQLTLSQEDTANLPEGDYLYEVSLNTGEYRCTFIKATRFILTKEIYKGLPTRQQAPENEMNPVILATIPNGYFLSGTLSQPGIRGYSAYEVAIANGFSGTESEWLESLKAHVRTDPSLNEKDVPADAYYTGQAINKKITSPAKAAVGQVLIVKSIDETGRPLTWDVTDNVCRLA